MHHSLLIYVCCSFLTSISRANVDKLEEKLRFTTSEDVPPGTIVGHVEKRSGYIYRLNERNRFFEFNSSSGEIRTSNEIGVPLLDREALERYGYKHDDVDFVILATATSSAISPPTYFLAVTVHVTDINDNLPTFPFAFQNVSLPESARVGTRLILASATDADEGENGSIKEYKLIGGNENSVFQLGRGGTRKEESPDAVFLELLKPVDRETKSLYVLNVSAADGGKPPLFGYLTIFVNILDSNDNEPIFDRQQYAVSVSENLPAGSSILLVSATDKDSGENARITYMIGNDVDNQFKVHPETGIIFSNTAPLKCPELKTTNSSYAPRLCTFTVEAVDHGVPALRGRAFVNVELFDVNDHAPEISFRYYSAGAGVNDELAAIVDETKPIGTVIAVVTVTDPDHGENGKTIVNIVKGNELGHFRLEMSDLFSVVRTNATLRRALIDKYELTIMAMDKGNPPKYSLKTMSIYVNDASDQPPMFDQSIYTAKVLKNAPLKSYVLDLRASSGHITTNDGCNAPVWYDIANDSNIHLALFHLDHKTGLITVARSLDSDQRLFKGNNFTFSVIAKDACRPSLRSSSAMVKIDLIDVNDQAPVFSKDLYNVAIYENASVGSVVLKLEAYDGDSGENGRISYSFIESINQSYLNYFQLQPSTGVLTLASPLDREKVDSYKLHVRAFDHGSPPLQALATIHIRVSDINDNAPKFTAIDHYVNLYSFDPAGTVLMNVHADDPDEGVDGEVTYFFLEPPPISSISLLPKTGEIYLKSRPTWSNALKRFDLILGASDGGGLRASNNATIHVYVIDVGNDANGSNIPRFTKDSYVFRLQEDSGISLSNGGTKSIGTVSATDSDSPISPSSPIQYKIVDGDFSALFEIGPYSGELRSTRIIDYEEGHNYTLTIAALGKSASSATRVRIEIDDLNDNAPKFLNNGTTVEVKRQWPAGYRFFIANAVDIDSGLNGAIRYSLLNHGDTLKYFGVDERTGVLFLKSPAYMPKKSSYTLTMLASDQGTPPLSDEAIFHIHIQDDDPRFQSTFSKLTYDFALWEDTMVNRKLIQLNLTKPCNTKNVIDCVYFAHDEVQDDVFGLFPDGWLYVKNVLDYERKASYQLNVGVRQRLGIKNGHWTHEVTSVSAVNLQLLDQNDNAPRCVRESFSFSLPEHSEQLAYVGTVTAEDADSGLNGLVKYRLLPDSENYAAGFRVGLYNGVLSALRSFDREILLKTRGSAVIDLFVEAEDLGMPGAKRTRCKVSVEISDINDHAPQFALDVYAVSLPENQETGSEILRVSTTDEDEFQNALIEFSIVEGDDEDRFSINSTTGQLFLRKSLDREEKNSYLLKLMAMDFGKPERLNSTAYATIFVLDTNDNAPKFVHIDRTIDISELASIGTRLSRIMAVDSDSGLAGTVRYTLTKGNIGQVFELDAITGTLILVKPLDFETQRNYSLTILAADQGSPSLMNITELFINVLDENDNAPLITTPVVVAQIPRDSPIGSRVLTIEATDSDSGLNGTISFKIVDQKPAPMFRIEEKTGLVFLAHAVDLESNDAYILIEVTDLCEMENLRLRTRRMITVLFTNGDGNKTAVLGGIGSPNSVSIHRQRPKLSDYFYQFQIREDASIGTTIGIVKVLDERRIDATVSQFLFSITNNSMVPFIVNAETGVLTTLQSLDRESISEFNFEVRADDNSVSTAFASVHVEVLDVNDNEPQFVVGENSTIRFTIVEGAQKNSFVGKVTALDKDAGANGEIEYSLDSPELALFFTLDMTTGVIRTNQFIDREEYPFFFLVVQATDRGNPPKRAKTTVFIEVLDINDNAPVMERSFYELSIYENATAGTVLMQFSAWDYDADTEFEYSIVSGNVWHQFAVDNNGTLIVSAPLDRETRSVYHLVVSVYDQPASSALRHVTNAQVTINVMDINDYAPRFVSTNWASINANAPIGSLITTVQAIDLDEGQSGVVNYLLDPKSAGFFHVDSISGDISLLAPLSKATGSMYNLSIWAYDRGEHSLYSNWQLFINVIGGSHHVMPKFKQKSYEISVPEDVPIGKNVLHLASELMDLMEDNSNGFRYWIVGDQNDGPDFEIAPFTGVLSIANPLDYERKYTYNLTVAVTNANSIMNDPDDVINILIRVKDVNDNSPIFTQSPVYFEVVEGIWTSQPIVVGLVTARDADSGANGKLSYSITQGNTTIFSIDSLSGELKMQGDVDREAIANYTLVVEATDSGTTRRTASTLVVITVLDINDNDPVFEQPSYVGSILENQPAGTLILQVSAKDADEGENGIVSYRLYSMEKLPFIIDERIGEIRTKTGLDREIKNRYEFYVMTMDSAIGERRTSSVRVLVNVLDENDNSPVFIDTAQDIYISSTALNGNFVYVVGVEDADEGENARLRYTLGGRDAKYFNILPDTGVIQWKAIPTLTSVNDFSIDVFVSDIGEKIRNASTSLRFFPRSATDFPIFAQLTKRNFSVSENQTNAYIVTITASSSKQSPLNHITYSIVSGNFGGAFSLNPLTGQLITTAKLDYEYRNNYELYVAATDNDNPPLSSFMEISVQIDDCNDNAPIFEKPLYTATILEEEPPPLRVVQVKARDADSGLNGKIRYSFGSLPTGIIDLFDIDSENGVITTKTALDREKTSEYKLIVEAIDGGSPILSTSAIIIVHVADINDNAPKFTRLFSAEVREDAAVGSFVVQVTSSDADSVENANNSYYLSVNPGDKFAIDSRSGNVTLSGQLDRETVSEYPLRVVAVDGSWRVETSLTITILDVNDNEPKFGKDHYRFNITELLPSLTLIGKMDAFDLDEKGPNSKITYRLAAKSSLFTVDSQTGELRTSTILRRGGSNSDFYHLTIIAEDGGRPMLSSTTQVTLAVISKRSHPSVFGRKSLMIAVPMHVDNGTKIRSVMAMDSVGRDENISYKLEDQNEKFEVDPLSDWILASKRFSSTIGTQYKFVIVAQDSESSAVLDKLEVTLIASEDNKNAPEFSSPTYSVTVPENTKPGSAIFTVSARDYDQGINGKVTYECVKNQSLSQGCEWFFVDEGTGVIVLKKELDYETMKKHKIIVSATDGGFEPKSTLASLYINVQDVNDNAPRFVNQNENMVAHVQENRPRGSVIYRLNCTDTDSPPYDTILYSIENGAEGYFAVDDKTGQVMVTGDIDYESIALYKLVVKCWNPDSMEMYSITNLTIYVDGVNEYLPHFENSEYKFEIDSSTNDGAIIGRVKAIDEDYGPDGVIFYAIDPVNGGQLAVNELTGDVTIKKGNQRNISTATVYAYNRGSTTFSSLTNARVMVTFGITLPLSLISKTLNVEVLENAPVGTVILALNATSRGLIFYELVSGNIGNAFHLDSATGSLRVQGQLDRETIESYVLTVHVSAGKRSGPSSSVVTVMVKILDVNDNAPYLTSSASTGYILENEPIGTAIMTLLPSDDDLPPNKGPFNFTLLSSKWSNLFHLDPLTGVLKSKAVFDRENVSRYMLPVRISDAGQPSLWAFVNLTIFVEDINDSPSSSDPIQVTILAFDSIIPDKTAAFEVTRILPADLDFIGNYNCKLRTNNNNSMKFILKPNCTIMSDQPLSAPSNYRLPLTGTDGVHDWVDYEATVVVAKADDDWAINSVSILVRGDNGKFAKTFLSIMENVIVGIGKRKLTPRIIHVSSKNTIFDDTLEIGLVIFGPDGRILPFSNAKSVLQLAAKANIFVDSGFRVMEVFGGYCISGENASLPCQNGGKCLELVNVNKHRYNFLTERAVSLSLPEIKRSYRCDCPSNFAGIHCERMVDQCAKHTCANGATCVYRKDLSRTECMCPLGFTGSECQDDIDECKIPNACFNNGWCENTQGSYRCVCMVGYGGSRCENSTNSCASDPCLNGGTCMAKNDGYVCVCEFGFTGRECQFGSVGFNEASYLEVKSDIFVRKNRESILQFEFATIHSNALILFSSKKADADFLAMDILNGKIRLTGLRGGKGGRIDVIIAAKKKVNDGLWHRIKIVQNGTKIDISIGDCSSSECTQCSNDDETCSAEINLKTAGALFPGDFLYFGTTRDFSRIIPKVTHLSAPGFVGCMRNLKVHNAEFDKLDILNQNVLNYCPRLNQPPCSSTRLNLSCSGGEKCQDGWSRPICSCDGGFSSSNCKMAEQPVSLSANGFISYKMAESYRRRLLFAAISPEFKNQTPDETYRIKRTSVHYPKQWMILEFRTTATDGLLFFAMTSNEEFTIIDIVNGTVRYMSRSKESKPIQISLGDGPYVSDGDWHLVSLALQSRGNEVEFRIDNFGKDAKADMLLHPFISANLSTLSIGGAAEPVKVTGNTLKAFNGCLRKFIVNGVVQPFNQGDVTFFEPTFVGDIRDGCETFSSCLTPPCPPTIGRQSPHFNAGLVAILVFFSCMALSMVVAYFIVRKFKLRRFGKKSCCALVGNSERTTIVGVASSMMANISTLSDIVRLRQESDCGNLNGSMKDSGIVLGVSRQTLDGSQISLNNPLDAHRATTASILSASTYLNNYLHGDEGSTNELQNSKGSIESNDRNGKNGPHPNPFLERYDLDDASSIAPSDADVAKHYKDYRQNGFNFFNVDGQKRQLPLKFAPLSHGRPDSSVPSLFESNYASMQSLGIGRNRKSPAFRTTPTSVLAMMPESESSDEVMMQRTLSVDPNGGGISEVVCKSRPQSNRSVRSKQRRNGMEKGNGKTRRSYRNSTKSKARRRVERRDSDESDVASDSTTSSDATANVRNTIGSGRRSLSAGINTTPRILSPLSNRDLIYQHSSTNDDGSDAVSAAINSEFDLDQLRKPRRFLQPPDETETESDMNAANGYGNVGFSIDQFIPGPRTLFLMSEDDNASETETEDKRLDAMKKEAGRLNGSNIKRNDDLEAYV